MIFREASHFAEQFARDYVGQSASKFEKALEQVYTSIYEGLKHHGRSIPILQSSGSGKSRMMYELSRTVCPLLTT